MTTSTDKKNPAVYDTAEAAAGGLGAVQGPAAGNMEFILDIPLEVTIELGRTKLLIH